MEKDIVAEGMANNFPIGSGKDNMEITYKGHPRRTRRASLNLSLRVCDFDVYCFRQSVMGEENVGYRMVTSWHKLLFSLVGDDSCPLSVEEESQQSWLRYHQLCSHHTFSWVHAVWNTSVNTEWYPVTSPREIWQTKEWSLAVLSSTRWSHFLQRVAWTHFVKVCRREQLRRRIGSHGGCWGERRSGSSSTYSSCRMIFLSLGQTLFSRTVKPSYFVVSIDKGSSRLTCRVLDGLYLERMNQNEPKTLEEKEDLISFPLHDIFLHQRSRQCASGFSSCFHLLDTQASCWS